MPNDKPPFRADHVGSLLRPIPLREARAAKAAGTMSAEALRAIEDTHIADVIAAQRAAGLRAVTDGEFRRAFWHYDFLGGLGASIWSRATRASSSRAARPNPMR